MKKETAKIDLSKIVEAVNKEFGKDEVIVIGDGARERHPTISSGSYNLDYVLNGGFAENKMIEAYGDNGSGKTTIALHALAEAQKMGKIAAFIDMEHALNLEYAETIGVDVDNLIFTQPPTGEKALGITESLIRKGVGFIVIDSVAAMIPQAELEGEYGESKMGLHARMMSQGMRKLVGIAHKSNTTLFFINQTRLKIGVMFGDPTTTTGGEALKFYTAQRIHVLSGTKFKDADNEIIGNEVTVKVVKNKIGSPHKKAKFRILYGLGIDKLWEIVEIAVSLEVIKKSGSWYSFGDIKLGQGENGLRTTLDDNPEVLEEIKKQCEL